MLTTRLNVVRLNYRALRHEYAAHQFRFPGFAAFRQMLREPVSSFILSDLGAEYYIRHGL